MNIQYTWFPNHYAWNYPIQVDIPLNQSSFIFLTCLHDNKISSYKELTICFAKIKYFPVGGAVEYTKCFSAKG